MEPLEAIHGGTSEQLEQLKQLEGSTTALDRMRNMATVSALHQSKPTHDIILVDSPCLHDNKAFLISRKDGAAEVRLLAFDTETNRSLLSKSAQRLPNPKKFTWADKHSASLLSLQSQWKGDEASLRETFAWEKTLVQNTLTHEIKGPCYQVFPENTNLSKCADSAHS